MAHKVHPKAHRLGYIADWDSRWFPAKNLAKYLEEDFIIKDFLKKKLKDASIEKIEIERSEGLVNVYINTARPGLLIGRAGRTIEEIKKELAKVIQEKSPLANEKRQIKLEIKEIKNPWTSANLVAQWVARRLERRIPYRTVLKQALSRIGNYKEVKGARIEVAGRLNGVTIARTEWLQIGRLPSHTLRADIDYAEAEALTTYGIIGIKVWIYKGEVFAKEFNQETNKK